MNNWRITYVEDGISSIDGVSLLTPFAPGPEGLKVASSITATSRIELRDRQGQIIRLGRGAEFALKDSLLGVAPETYGEVFLKNSSILTTQPNHKYRTTCWTGAKIGPTIADIFFKPGSDENTDEYFLITGAIAIYEFDENNLPYVICSFREGEKAVVQYDPSASGLSRYASQVTQMSDEEYEYILRNYIDGRRWRA